MSTPSTAFAMHATWDPGSPSACGGCTADYSWWDGEGNRGFLRLCLGLKRLEISPGKAWGRRRKWAKKKVSDLTNRRAPSSCLSTCLIPAGQTSHVLAMLAAQSLESCKYTSHLHTTLMFPISTCRDKTCADDRSFKHEIALRSRFQLMLWVPKQDHHRGPSTNGPRTGYRIPTFVRQTPVRPEEILTMGLST